MRRPTTVDPELDQRFRVAVLGKIAEAVGVPLSRRSARPSSVRPQSQGGNQPYYDQEGFSREHRAMSRRRRKWKEHTEDGIRKPLSKVAQRVAAHGNKVPVLRDAHGFELELMDPNVSFTQSDFSNI